jgi:hypothetical protein
LVDRFPGGGNAPGFRHAEDGAARDQPRQSAGETGGDSGHRPHANGDGDGDREADAVDPPSGGGRAGRVRQREGRQDPAVLLVGEMKLAADQNLQRGQRLPVQEIDGGGENERGQHQPAESG